MEPSQGGFLVARVHQLAGRVFAKLLKNADIQGLNPAQGRILRVLWHHDEVPISVLAEMTSLGNSTLTSMLDRLEEAGYLTRVQAGKDRRKNIIQLTYAGRESQDAFGRVAGEMADCFYRGFSSDEIGAFEGYLQRILLNLEAAEKKG